MTTQPECSVCCETYNKASYFKVTCIKCNYSSCRVCNRRYLLNSTKPGHCMNCKEEWCREFMVNNLSRCYVNGDYRNHREKLLLGTAKARLSEDMDAAAAVNERDKLILDQRKVNEELRLLKEKRRTLEMKIWRCRRIVTGELAEKGKKREFLKKCPSDNCNGMLSTAWKCKICDLTVCAKCHEIKDDPSSGGGVEHVCKQENIDSVKFIKKDTKGCPGCGTDIHKISGCDQMWCPQCQKAFSWRTGNVVIHGIIHNPHFHAWQREQTRRGIAAPRAPGDVICGGLPGNHQWRRVIALLHPEPNRIPRYTYRLVDPGRLRVGYKLELWQRLQLLHRNTAHFQEVILRPIRVEVNGLNNNRDLRINYIIGNINEKTLAHSLSRRAIKKEKSTATLHIYELLNTVLTENIINLYHIARSETADAVASVTERAPETLRNCHDIRIYTNEQLKNISVIYGQTVKGLDSTFNTFSIKYTKSSLKREREKKQQTAELTGLSMQDVNLVIDDTEAII